MLPYRAAKVNKSANIVRSEKFGYANHNLNDLLLIYGGR